MPTTRSSLLLSTSLVLSGLVLASCGTTGTQSSAPTADPAQDSAPLAQVQHVHAIVANPDGEGLILGTHQGILHVTDHGVTESVGPVMDFMGLSDTGQGRLVASGHPGPDTDMPNPVGLIESTDGGRTWQTLSRAGESDFHALAATEDTVIGFDGALRATDDGRQWRDLDPDVDVIALAASDDAETVLATTQQGLSRSVDGGRSFTGVDAAPPLVLLDWVREADTVYGIDTGGTVHRSDDTGQGWTALGTVDGQPEAMYADEEQVVVAAEGTLVLSSDGGQTFEASDLGSD